MSYYKMVNVQRVKDIPFTYSARREVSFFHTLAYFSVMLQAIRTSKVSK